MSYDPDNPASYMEYKKKMVFLSLFPPVRVFMPTRIISFVRISAGG
jgi:hypothetical protein